MFGNRDGRGLRFCKGVGAVMLAVVLLMAVTVRAEVVKKRVAVLPWKVNAAGGMNFLSGAVSEMLTSRLGSLKSVTVERSDLLKKALGGVTAKSGTAPLAADIGAKLKLDYVLYGSITLLGDSVSLDAKLLDVKAGSITTHFATGRGIDSVVALADTVSRAAGLVVAPAPVPPSTEAAVRVPLPLPVVTPALPPVEPTVKSGFTGAVSSGAKGVEKFWKGPFMDGLYVAMASADLDKDGVNELFLLKGSSVTVAVARSGRFDIVKELKVRGDIQFVAIDAIDTNHDGVFEVYVSGVKENAADSFSIEYRDGEYRWALKGLRRLFRSIERDGRSLLVGQGFREADGFYGALGIYEAQGAGLVNRGVFEPGLPAQIDIYRFTLLNDGDGSSLLAALSARNHLTIYKKSDARGWQREWKSSEYYGGTLNYIDVVDEDNETRLRILPVESRLVYTDADGNGTKELVVKTGTPGGFGRYAEFPRSYSGGAVLGLSWDGQFLNELWRTKQLSGYVADFFIERDEKGATVWMLVAEGGGAMFGKPKSYVLSYRLAL